MIKKCIICGKEFDAVKSFGKYPITCGTECFKINRRNHARKHYQEVKKNKKKTNRQIHNDFVNINKKAHDLGISYNQNVALYMNDK